jgi:hypothetical protein
VFYLIRFIPFFFCFFSLPFPLFFSLSSLSSLLPHTNSNQQPSAERTEDRAPSAAPSMASLLPLYAASNAFPLPPPCSQQHIPPIPLLPPPPLTLPSELTMASHGALKSGHGRLPWRGSTKLVFFVGQPKQIHKTFHLLSPLTILSETNSNLRILWDFIFQPN